ncbi:MAG: TIGR03986 family CRISPR-associated RAMP protein [Calditrichia bacterium]
MAEWKKGKIVNKGGGAFHLMDENGTILLKKARLIRQLDKNILTNGLEGMGNEKQVLYRLSEEGTVIGLEEIVQAPQKQPGTPQTGSGKPNEFTHSEEIPSMTQHDIISPGQHPIAYDVVEIKDELTHFPPPQNISRAQGRAEEGAFAPYNFVRMPEKPVMAVWHSGEMTYSGEIICRMLNKEPFFIRDGRLGEDPATNTFQLGSDNKPAIPGTSIKGVLRSIIEAATGNGYDRVQPQHFFMRDMGTGNKYAQMFVDLDNDDIFVKAGFLKKIGKDFFIQPCEWAKVSINDLPDYLKIEISSASKLIKNRRKVNIFKNNYGKEIKFKGIKRGGYSVKGKWLSFNQIIGFMQGEETGWLVYSGPIRKKEYEAVFYNRVQDQNKWLPIEAEKVEAYAKDINEYKKELFGEKLKFNSPEDEIPVFYLEEKRTDRPYFFGRNQMFRVPYTFNLVHYVPDEFRGGARSKPEICYFSEKLFGTLNMLPASGKPKEEEQLAVAGKVSISPAKYKGRWENNSLITGANPAFLVQEPRYLKTLNNPKPSSYQLYLEQKKGEPLKDYFVDPKREKARIAGRKFYWHKRGTINSIFAEGEEVNRKVQSKARPLAPNHVFEFSIGFNGLTAAEVGALLWAIKPWPESCWKIGAGKPLGMGSVEVSIQKAFIEKEDGSRYKSLLPGKDRSETDHATLQKFIEEFKNYVHTELGQEFDDLTHLKDLRALLDYSKKDQNISRKIYMSIEHEPGKSAWRARKIMKKASDF